MTPHRTDAPTPKQKAAPMRTKTATALAAITLAAITATTPNNAQAQTGGQLTPCPGSPYGNGWFDTWNFEHRGAINCTQQDNHIVLDAWNSQGQRTQAVVNTWYGHQCDQATFHQPAPGSPFRINLRNNHYGQPWAPGCGTQGATIQTDTATLSPPNANPINTNHYGTWWSARTVNTAWPQTVNMCYVTSAEQCTQTDGYTIASPHGINKGPFVAIRFGGASPNGRPSTFITSISVHVNS